MTRRLRDPLWWCILVCIAIVAACLLLAGCGGARPASAIKPTPSPKAGVTQHTEPTTSAEAWDQVERLQSDKRKLEAEIAGAREDAKRLEAKERRDRLVLLASIVQWVAALASLGGVVLTVLSFVRPELRFLRAIAGIGALAAMIIWGLAGYIPDAVVYLGPLAIVLTITGAGWLLWHIIRANHGLAGAVRVVEKLKPYVDLEPSDRRRFQAEVLTKSAAKIIDRTKEALRIPPRVEAPEAQP